MLVNNIKSPEKLASSLSKERARAMRLNMELRRARKLIDRYKSAINFALEDGKNPYAAIAKLVGFMKEIEQDEV